MTGRELVWHLAPHNYFRCCGCWDGAAREAARAPLAPRPSWEQVLVDLRPRRITLVGGELSCLPGFMDILHGLAAAAPVALIAGPHWSRREVDRLSELKDPSRVELDLLHQPEFMEAAPFLAYAERLRDGGFLRRIAFAARPGDDSFARRCAERGLAAVELPEGHGGEYAPHLSADRFGNALYVRADGTACELASTGAGEARP